MLWGLNDFAQGKSPGMEWVPHERLRPRTGLAREGSKERVCEDAGPPPGLQPLAPPRPRTAEG